MTKKIALLIAVALGGAAGTPARAAAWQIVDSTASVQTEVDLGSAVRKDGTVTGWVQRTYSRKTTTQSGAYFVFRSMKEQVRLNCSQQTATVLTRGYFDDDGSEIASIRGSGETRTVMPDTPEQRVLTRLCNPGADSKTPTAKAAPSVRAAAAPAAATTAAVDPRFMDGPAPSQLKPGIIRAKADGHDAAPPAAPSIVKPVEKIDPKSAEKPEAKPVEAKPAEQAKATERGPAPAAAAHGAASARPKASAHEPAPAYESREATLARIMKARSGAPVAPDSPPRSRSTRVAVADHASPAAGAHEAHWNYEGEYAPYRWGDMKPDYATCKTGARQSPIDIRNPVIGEVEPIQFHYEDVPLKVTNNGHTIQVDYAPGSFILFGGSRYELIQFHFHSPSEERINGRAFDMVAHLVHKSPQGRLAVIAVLLSAGAEQALLQKVWAAMPGTRDRTRERLDVPLNARDLLPLDRTYYSYMGSLTTPPCTEGVQWLVMKTPVEISREQIAHFTALYPMNARPLQALNDRLIKVGK